MDSLEYFPKPFTIALDERLPLDENLQSQRSEIQHEPTTLVDNSDPVSGAVEEVTVEQPHVSVSSFVPDDHGTQVQPILTDFDNDRHAEGGPFMPISVKDGSSTSSSDSSSDGRSPPSLYDREFLAPTIQYTRDDISQKLIAIIGREFDKPAQIAADMQALIQKHFDNRHAKFVPFTVRRKALLKGAFDSRDIRHHDLICFCYNASEARILLTGPDGFYTTLLRLVEALLGPNKVAFIVSNYSPPGYLVPNCLNELISPVLRTRLYNQDSLKHYLENEQVLSWKSEPSICHIDALVRLANLDCNPVKSCVLL